MQCYACIKEMPTVSDWFECGWGNGYVLVPIGHRLYGKRYNDDNFPDIDVHGGVTWDGGLPGGVDLFEFIGERPDNLDTFWSFGFDTAHCYDNASLDKEWVIKETLRFKAFLEAM